MWSLLRSLFVVLVSAAAVCAQDAATPTPSPTPAESPAASPTPAENPASPEPTPPPPLAPAPEASPAATPDVIPMEGSPSPSGGAPLDTQNIGPETAMPEDAFTQPNAVIPDVAPPAIGQSLDNAQEKLRLQNVRYKEVRIQADKDPKVKNLLDQANAAKTPEDKRAALREYYRLLFKKMVSIDNSLEKKCTDMEQAYLRRLAQDRLEPTIPLNPPPTPAPLN